MRRFFYQTMTNQPLNQHQIGDTLLLTTDIHHHWSRVLRAKVGDEAYLFDGFGGAYQVKLVEVNKNSSFVQLLHFIDGDNTTDFLSEIGLVMSRGDRMDYAIQKATEMGVTVIQLLTSEHGEVRLKSSQVAKKLKHWQQVAISACEQCGMNRPPIIVAPLTLTQWLSLPTTHDYHQDSVSEVVHPLIQEAWYEQTMLSPELCLVLSVPKNQQPAIPKQLHQVMSDVSNGKVTANNTPLIRLLIGAEGGLSEAEMQQAERVGFLPWQIGNRVLRTETAPVVALATLQAML